MRIVIVLAAYVASIYAGLLASLDVSEGDISGAVLLTVSAVAFLVTAVALTPAKRS